jgi:hypothetical protein
MWAVLLCRRGWHAAATRSFAITVELSFAEIMWAVLLCGYLNRAFFDTTFVSKSAFTVFAAVLAFFTVAVSKLAHLKLLL